MTETGQWLALNSFSQDKNFANFFLAHCTEAQLQKDSISKSNIFLGTRIFDSGILSSIKVLQDEQLGERSIKEGFRFWN